MSEDKQPSSEIRRLEKTCSSRSYDYEYDYQMNEYIKMRYNYSDLSNNNMFVQRSTISSSSSSSSSQLKKQRSSSEESISSDNRKLGEVEQAAILLMCLSCGSVFA